MTATTRNVLRSTQQDWATPPDAFHWLDAHFHYTLDAAAADDNHLLPRYYTPATDGLAQQWAGETVFINPPYGRGPHGASLQAPWFRKAYEQVIDAQVVSTLLVPPRTDTRWWHTYVRYARAIWFIRPRIAFLDPKTGKPARSNTTPSCLVVFGPALYRHPDVVFVSIGEWVA